MAPAANTARPRRVPGSGALPADSDSDLEFQAYNRRLNEASAARARLRKVYPPLGPFRPARGTDNLNSPRPKPTVMHNAPLSRKPIPTPSTQSNRASGPHWANTRLSGSHPSHIFPFPLPSPIRSFHLSPLLPRLPPSPSPSSLPASPTPILISQDAPLRLRSLTDPLSLYATAQHSPSRTSTASAPPSTTATQKSS